MWIGRWVVSHIAVRQLGHTPGEVARALGVSIQSVLRGVEKGGRLVKTLGWGPDEAVRKRK